MAHTHAWGTAPAYAHACSLPSMFVQGEVREARAETRKRKRRKEKSQSKFIARRG